MTHADYDKLSAKYRQEGGKRLNRHGEKSAQRLGDQASFVVEIIIDDEYQQALTLMDEFIDDCENHLVLIELLFRSIAQWESHCAEFAEFNECVSSGDPAVSLLRTLMDQHDPGVQEKRGSH